MEPFLRALTRPGSPSGASPCCANRRRRCSASSVWPGWPPLGALSATPLAGETGAPHFTVPEGFRVEKAAKDPDPKDVFSLVNMTFDAKGRLLVSQESGPVLLCTDPDKDGVLQNVRLYCSIVKNCQGMCWVGDALLLVGEGPHGAGLYRCRDTKGKDEIDEATLILSYGENGKMGEHGPHAVLHGPDGSLYVINGNHAWAKVDKLAANSAAEALAERSNGPGPGPARLDGGHAAAAAQRPLRPWRRTSWRPAAASGASTRTAGTRRW